KGYRTECAPARTPCMARRSQAAGWHSILRRTYRHGARHCRYVRRAGEPSDLQRGKSLDGAIVGAFPSWVKSHSEYGDLDLSNVVVVTLPQPIIVQTIRTGAIALGNLALEFTRASGFYPDIVMAAPNPH